MKEKLIHTAVGLQSAGMVRLILPSWLRSVSVRGLDCMSRMFLENVRAAAASRIFSSTGSF